MGRKEIGPKPSKLPEMTNQAIKESIQDARKGFDWKLKKVCYDGDG